MFSRVSVKKEGVRIGNGFINNQQAVTTNNYNTVTDFDLFHSSPSHYQFTKLFVLPSSVTYTRISSTSPLNRLTCFNFTESSSEAHYRKKETLSFV
jgi:hypothetical protein